MFSIALNPSLLPASPKAIASENTVLFVVFLFGTEMVLSIVECFTFTSFLVVGVSLDNKVLK